MKAIFPGLHWRLTVTIFARMRPFVVVVLQPDIHIDLQFFDRFVNLLPECSRIKLFLHCPVKTFTDTVCLRTFCFCFCVFDFY